MADILSENETKQSEPLTNLYRDIDGRYRWTYEMIAKENPSYRNTLLLIFALVILVPGLILFFMIAASGCAEKSRASDSDCVSIYGDRQR